MRKLNLESTKAKIHDKIQKQELYGFYGLTENKDVDKYDEKFAREHYRFSCSGSEQERAKKENKLAGLLYAMQDAYLKSMNLNKPLFRIVGCDSKMAPYGTVVIDIVVETAKGAFDAIVRCTGPDEHQFHAKDLWVRANKKAGVWKSLYDFDEGMRVAIESTNYLDTPTVDAWLAKVKDARDIIKDCITTKGEPTEEQKAALCQIMMR